MPILFKTITHPEEVFDGFQCDRCKKEFRRTSAPGHQEEIEIQEMFHWKTIGGWGSVWGDGVAVSLTLCQKCVFEVLGEHVKYEDEEAKEATDGNV